MSLKSSVKAHFTYSSFSPHLNKFHSHILGINDLNLHNDTNELKIRKFTLRDTDKCAELFKNVFSAYPWYDEWTSLDQSRKYLMELIKNPVFEGFVACEGQEIAAVCFGHRRSWWMGKEFFIDEFYVQNEVQGNGIGTQLLDYVKNNLKTENYTRLVLLTNKGIPAEEFYIKNGFNNNQKRIVMVKEI
ncbi:MAG: GNAT family N-acetyltransferase [Methanobacterium sp.]|uniref:GNAT family N-acetyltransferase n=1 Tax=Methanobacterium sp. TaxID=2164 RepID=UPI003D64899F|nr:GNAT family N-acetyltransferase [Methanobacterium sp.]